MQIASRLVLPLPGVLQATEADLRALVSSHPEAEIHVSVPQATAMAALSRGTAAIARILHEAGRPGPVVRLDSDAPAHLQALRDAGAAAVEWTVTAPLPAAAQAFGCDDDAFLRQSLAVAAGAGMPVRLRWLLSRPATAALADLGDLAGLVTSVAVEPWLDGLEAAPVLAEVAAAWANYRSSAASFVATATAPGSAGPLRVLRSAYWPACLAAPADAIEPISPRQAAAAAMSYPAGCNSCPARMDNGCAGMAAPLLAATEAAGFAFTGWRGSHLDTGSASRPSTTADDPPLAFAPSSVEARGLDLGLRRAFRLRLDAAAVPGFTTAAVARGLHVAASALAVSAEVGGRLRPLREGDTAAAVLVVAAREDAVARACLRDELDNLLRPQPQSGEDWADDLEATLAVHRRLGAAYGYPACCVEAFCDAHSEIVHTSRVADNAVALLRAHRRSRSYDPRLAALGGAFGERNPSPLRHLPCRFDCPQSQALAAALLPPGAVAKAVPVVVLSDGSLLHLHGRPVPTPDGTRPVAVTGVTRIDARLSPHAGKGLQAALQPLLTAPPSDLQVRPGTGLAVLREGIWQPVPLPQPPSLLASSFPILLPFA